VDEDAKRFAPIGELRHVEITLTLILLTWRIWCSPSNASKWQLGFNSAFKGLNSLQNKLRDLKAFLPKVGRRRGLINAGISILKVLFGTATVRDVQDVHITIDVMQRKENAIVHSLDQQVTYFKKLD